ncbi:hypothetical protein BIW11_07126 [Tropilaelaps mercedesae]|uniref:Cuticle protein 10.9-like n=1 Tax=Tropilaelaps mercedesae TaxID=418985 RepID=A0A1V9XV73_9ACAR|nr:hypothetical protein BIW11_07126 [Tropilaelaps mercedesae]
MSNKVGVLVVCVAVLARAQNDVHEQLRRAGYDVTADRGYYGVRTTSDPWAYRQNDYVRGRQTQTRTNVVEQYPQRPYEYGYQLDDTNGSHGHIEKRDESGRVEGEYSINLGDGRIRVVKYVADENGYRADITTDELGTESKNPNDVYIGSTAISGYEAALKYGPFAPPHIEAPLEPAPRPEAPRVVKAQAVDTRVRVIPILS